jgi:general secretion pathway protein M
MLHVIKNKINRLGSRDKRALLGIVGVLGLSLIFVAVIQPAKSFYDREKLAYLNEVDLKNWLAEHRGELKRASALTRGDGSRTTDKDQLLGLISRTAEAAKIELSRLEPSEGSVVISIDKASFSNMLGWLEILAAEHDVAVAELVVTRLDVNVASARLRLQ